MLTVLVLAWLATVFSFNPMIGVSFRRQFGDNVTSIYTTCSPQPTVFSLRESLLIFDVWVEGENFEGWSTWVDPTALVWIK